MRRVLGKWCGARPGGGGVTSSTVVGGTHGSRPTTTHFVGQGPRALPGMREKTGRADVGSELSAAGGRGGEVSEWLRSKFPASAVRQRRNFGHRNRIIGPYGGFTDRIS